ncbi:unnamed protein product [Ostreobium quekettii]|uniref:Actin-related protein 5 n=1 Tax=Ostreobium quekettii TaxID=121088 RepID=A0A8S1J8K1_9CHLO|nr:unnamed protein product [Ostreobium quekettii]
MAQKGRDDAGGLALRIQLPWKPVKLPTKAELEEEAAQKAARAAEQRQRLKDMVDARKAKNMRDKEIHIKLLKDAAAQVECAESSAAADDILKRIDMEDYEELKKRIDEAEATLQRLKGLEPAEQIGPDGKQGAKLDLLDVTDSELTPEQLAEKRRQRLAKHAADARAKLKAKKEQERLEQEQLLRQEDEALRSDPERYLEALKQRHRTAAQRVENRKRRRLGAATAGASDEPTAAGCRRVSSEQRHRMRLLARAAAEGKRLPEEDTFGENDRDWDVYKEMDRNYSDSEVEREDDTEYNWTAARLQGLGQASCIVDISGDRPEEAQPQVAEDYQLCLGVERIRVPELLFQPSMCGIDQAGAGEVLAIMLREMPAELAERCASGGLLITGGNSAYPGLDVRLESELRSSRPEGRPIRVVRSPDAMLDAWRGAALMATVPGMFEGAYTKAEYEERGPQGLRRRCHASYSLPFRQQGP